MSSLSLRIVDERIAREGASVTCILIKIKEVQFDGDQYLNHSYKIDSAMSNRKNLFEMYIENGCKMGFFVSRETWSNGKYARVVAIDGVVDGQQIEGDPPYFNQKHPAGHEKAGATLQRNARLEADWFDGGFTITTGAGGYTWTRVYP